MDHSAAMTLFAVAWTLGWAVPGSVWECSERKRGAPQWAPWAGALLLGGIYGLMTKSPEAFLSGFFAIGLYGWVGWIWGHILSNYSHDNRKK